jgi:hypothetical protein
MPSYPISPTNSVQLNGSGAGQVGLTPPSGVTWQLSLATVSIPNPVNIPQAFLYLGSSSGPLQLIDSTYAGAAASTSKIAATPISHGMYVWAVWSGADPNTTATLQLFGTAS